MKKGIFSWHLLDENWKYISDLCNTGTYMFCKEISGFWSWITKSQFLSSNCKCYTFLVKSQNLILTIFVLLFWVRYVFVKWDFSSSFSNTVRITLFSKDSLLNSSKLCVANNMIRKSGLAAYFVSVFVCVLFSGHLEENLQEKHLWTNCEKYGAKTISPSSLER